MKRTVQRGPLHGLRVVDAGTMIAGPYAATLLGDLGADVIKVEPPHGDDLRHLGARRDGETGSYIGINRNKRSIVLDLTAPEGRAVLRRLVRTADVLITNVRPQALHQLGLSYEQVRRVRRDIIWAGVTTYGTSGPYAGRPGIDAMAQAVAGVMAVTGEPDGMPQRVLTPAGDVMASLLVVSGVLAALHERGRSGKGQRIDVSLLDAWIHAQGNLLGNYLLAEWEITRAGNRSPYFAPAGAYVCADGRLIYLSCHSDRFFKHLCGALEVEWDQDPRFGTMEARLKHQDELDRMIGEQCRRFRRADLLARLAAADVMAAPVQSIAEAVLDPQVLHNDMIVSVRHPALGPIRLTGVPIHLSRTPGSVRRHPPAVGEHTEETLQELGYSPEQVARLRRRGVIVG